MNTEYLSRYCKTVLILLISGSFPLNSAAQEYSVTVSAGGFDRLGTVVSFSFPHKVEQGIYPLTAPSGKTHYLQVDEHSKAWFILDSLSAGSNRIYSFSAGSANPTESNKGVRYAMDGHSISFQTDQKEILNYFYRNNNPPASLDDRYKRGGYIHPVYSPGGTELTSHLNEDHHPHHLGIWSAWTKTKFQGRTPDFWNFHDDTGNVQAGDSLVDSWDGPVQAGFRNNHFFIDHSAPEAVVALNEQWEVRVYAHSQKHDFFMFDIAITQTANTGAPLILQEYHYGGLAVRGHASWDDLENVSFLTSEGAGREGDATRVRWNHMGGLVNGKAAGITMMGHPANFRHPQPVRIHPEIPYFNFAPSQSGDIIIEPGSVYTSNYRFITYDGEPDSDQLNRLWNDYAYPPGVTVQPLKSAN